MWLFALMAVGCKNGSKGQYASGKQDLRDEIMAIHDSVMPKMGDINRLKATFERKLTETDDEQARQRYQAEIDRLERAGDLMMDWMHRWHQQESKLDKESPGYKSFLLKQKKAIIAVSDSMYHAMQHAKQVLKDTGNE